MYHPFCETSGTCLRLPGSGGVIGSRPCEIIDGNGLRAEGPRARRMNQPGPAPLLSAEQVLFGYDAVSRLYPHWPSLSPP